MNSETGQIKREDQLSEDEKKSGKWFKLPDGVRWQEDPLAEYWKHYQEDAAPRLPLSKSEVRREEYMRQVLEKKKAGVNV